MRSAALTVLRRVQQELFWDFGDLALFLTHLTHSLGDKMSAGPFRPKIALVCGRFVTEGGAVNIYEVKAEFGDVGKLSVACDRKGDRASTA